MGLIFVLACEPSEEQITSSESAGLTFSADTVLFDTLFTTVGSITKRLKVYNRNDNAVRIDRIALGKGENSSYSIIVNGNEGTEFVDEVILGKDSMLVLVSVHIDPMDNDLPFLVKDSVVVHANGNFGHVKLVAWGQDAIFLGDQVIDCNTTWTSNRPYVLYDTVLVDTLCVLNIDPGARIFIENNISMFVKGSMRINGTVDNKVIIRNTRLDPKFDIAPGQWGGLFFLEGTFDNVIEHAVISNGQIGIRLGSPDADDIPEISIGNTIIEHMSSTGILSFTSDLYVYNTVIYNCGDLLIGNLAGGNYLYEHCTFSNDPNDFFRDGPSVIISDNFIIPDQLELSGNLNIGITNSIIWGRENDEFVLDGSAGRVLGVDISNNIIRSTDQELVNLGNIINQERNYPGFYDSRIFDYRLDSLANARNAGNDIGILTDILGNDRDEMPDFGAYERLDSIQ